jgi:hypothetical protein
MLSSLAVQYVFSSFFVLARSDFDGSKNCLSTRPDVKIQAETKKNNPCPSSNERIPTYSLKSDPQTHSA